MKAESFTRDASQPLPGWTKESERESSTFKVAFDKEINADQDQTETPTQE